MFSGYNFFVFLCEFKRLKKKYTLVTTSVYMSKFKFKWEIWTRFMDSVVRYCFNNLTTMSVDLGGGCVGAGITEAYHGISIPDDGHK